MKTRYIVLLIATLAILAALCTTASAGGYGEGCPYDNWYNGTLHGGIYFQTKGHYTSAGETLDETFENVPADRKIVRLYTGVWLGSPSAGRVTTFNITVNGHTDTYSFTDNRNDCTDPPQCDVVDEPECNADYTGCGAVSINYNATPYVVTGTNNIKVWTEEQLYQISLLVVYENESMPEIQYWVKEGHEYPDDNYTLYFNETVNTGGIYTGSIESMKFWTLGYPHGPGSEAWPELSGNYVDACDYVYSYDATGNVYEGTPRGKEYEVFYRWDNIPPEYITRPSNRFYYPAVGNDRMMVPVLMLNYSEPSELNVTDISPESLCVDYYNTIDATIVNRGGTARLFNATLYANGAVVDVKPISNLGEGESRTVKFLWNPGATGSYVLNVTADVENVIKESDKTNNSRTLNVEVTVASLPEWQSQSSNVTSIPNGGAIELKAQGRADLGLDHAVLATDETGSWANITDGRYGSPLDMDSYYDYSLTHTTESDWKAQTIDNLSVISDDVKLYRMVGTTNLALNQPAYADSNYSIYEPGEAVDGTSDPWVSGELVNRTGWWYVDLGGVKDVQQIKIDFHEGWGSVPYKYTVDISNNAADWTTKIEKSVGHDETYDNLGWSCRYIRVNVLDVLGSNPYVAIAEFEAYPPGDYKSSGTLTSSAISTDNPVISVIPGWNSTEPTGTSLSVKVSVDDGATWKPAVNGEELTWDYDTLNNKLKYKVLLETTDVSKTPVLHDISLDYKTRDPVEGTWLWSNFTWHNPAITNKTVSWKIYYVDTVGKTNCTDIMSFDVGTTGPDTTGPITSNVAAEPNPTNGANTVTLTATIDDSTTGNSIIAAAEYFVDAVGGDGTGTAMSASDGTFDSVLEGVTADIDVSGWAVGNYTLYVHGKDAANNWGVTESVVLEVTEAGGVVEDKAKEDIPVKGTVTGSYVDTHTSDDMREAIEEVSSVGAPSSRYSYLEHKWSIDVTGDSDFVFYLEAHHSPSTDGDDFEFAYSKDDTSYTPMVTVTKTADNDAYQSYTFTEPITGTVYIRVQDTDRNAGNMELNTVYIDHMYIKSVSSPPSYGVTVTIDEASQKVKPGESTTYTVRVKNTGDLDASYSVAISGTAVDESTIDVSPLSWNTGTLTPNAEDVQTVTVSTTSSTPETTYTLTATATCEQDAGVTDSATSELVVSAAEYNVDKANADMPVKGTVTGSYVDTHASDDVRESIEEVLSGGKPASRYSLLEHKWSIGVTGNSDFVFYLEAHHSPSTDGDDFEFAYSKDDTSYTPMVTVTKTADDDTYQSYTFTESITGTVYIRVQDTDRTAGKQELNTVYIDHMYIRSKSGPPSYGVAVTIDEASQTVKPGESTTYTIRVKNTDGLDASYSVVMSGTAVGETTITVSPLSWNTGTLAPNAENVQTVAVSTTSSTSETTYTLTATATCEQDASVTDSATSELVVSSASYTDDKAKEDIPVKGTVSGSYVDTQTSDDVRESVEEALSGGKPANRYSYLEHKWSVDVTGGSTVTFYVEAYHSSSTDGDDFEFAYSKSVDGTYTPMVTVTKTADNDAYQTYTFTEPISGTVYVRVQDTNRDAGKQELNTVYIDHMFIRSEQ